MSTRATGGPLPHLHWSGRASLVVGLACVLVAVGCSKSKGQRKFSRNRDAAAVVVVSGTQDVGSLADEVEPNGDVGTAQEVLAGSGVRASLEGESDQDFFVFEAQADGYLSAVAEGIDGVDLVVELRSEAGLMLARSDRGPAKVSEGVPNYPVVAKQRYLIVVTEYVKKSRKHTPRTGPSPPYSLKLRVTDAAEARHEQELNDGEDGAVELAIPDEAFGYVGWAGDIDLWRLPVAGLRGTPAGSAAGGEWGAVTGVDLDLAGVEGVSLVLELLDHVGRVIATRSGAKGGNVAVRGFVPTDEEYLQIRVSGKRSHPELPYALKVSSRTMDVLWEREPNDTADRATRLPPEEEAVAAMRGYLTGKDLDFFELAASPEPRLISATLRMTSGGDGILEISTSGGKLLAAADAGKQGHTEVLTDIAVPAGVTTLVRVRGAESERESELYELTWSAVVGTPAVDPLSPDLGDLIESP